MSTKKIARFQGWRVVWHGGEYAEIIPHGGRVAVDVLNLWDHENDRPNDAYTTGDLRGMLKVWLSDNRSILSDHLASAGY